MDTDLDQEMSLIGHLTELRKRLIICLISLALCVGVGLFFAKPVSNVLTKPVRSLQREPGRGSRLTLLVGSDGVLRLQDPEATLANLSHLSQKQIRVIFPGDQAKNLPDQVIDIGEESSQKLYAFGPVDPFLLYFKVSLILGLLLSLPVLLWQIWLFIAPGLKVNERKIVKPLLAGAVVLFPIGAGFAYFMIRLILQVMQAYTPDNVDPLLNVFQYISFLFNMMLTFGVIFEIPLVIAIAARIGLVTPALLQRYRRHAYVILAIAAMMITPGTDPVSMVAALVPLVVLYELSIALAKPMAMMHQRDLENKEIEPEEESAV